MPTPKPQEPVMMPDGTVYLGGDADACFDWDPKTEEIYKRWIDLCGDTMARIINRTALPSWIRTSLDMAEAAQSTGNIRKYEDIVK